MQWRRPSSVAARRLDRTHPGYEARCESGPESGHEPRHHNTEHCTDARTDHRRRSYAAPRQEGAGDRCRSDTRGRIPAPHRAARGVRRCPAGSEIARRHVPDDSASGRRRRGRRPSITTAVGSLRSAGDQSSSVRNTIPVRSFGVKNVDFGGMSSRSAAVRRISSIPVGRMRMAASACP